MPNRLTKEDFVKNAEKIWGDEYDYKDVNYVNTSTKVKIIHKKCGRSFMMTPNNHTNKTHPKGCPYCAHRHSGYSLEEVLKKLKENNSDYDYSLITEYHNRRQKLPIICKKHGLFYASFSHLMAGHGCKLCAHEKMIEINKKHTKTTEEFIKQAKEVHGNKYDYSKTVYINAKTKVCIICPEHGEFWQIPRKHLSGQGCTRCVHNLPLTTDVFKKLLFEKYGDSITLKEGEEVKGGVKKIVLICKTHGEFLMSPRKALLRPTKGCPKCQKSGLEFEVENALKNGGVSFVYQQRFEWLKYKNTMPLDYYLPDYNIAIECQGEQHFEPIKRFGGVQKFELNKIRDTTKKRLCDEHGIKVLYFTHYSKIQEGGDIYKDADKLLNEITKNKFIRDI